ncbi:MCE family protein [Nocardioides sp. DS6]|uniref:MCE family protein n=1 Tax=Nocardioides eburneus TaxID=3231482 RepID=A0ABV3STB9_9ACTN
MSARALTPRRVAAGVAALATGALVSGCSLSGAVYNAPLPGGADVGDHPITLSADFTDVLDLVPQSAVKVDDVAVGRVSKISLNPDGHSAHVTLVVNGDVDLPVGTSARLDQTSLLGEKYVALVPPTQSTPTSVTAGTSVTAADAGAMLQTGDRIPRARTSEAVDIEQLFGALSLVLNGGDIGQFQEISRELQKVGKDRPQEIRSFLTEMNRFVATLDDRKSAITGALDGLDKLGKVLHRNEGKIATALDGLSPGMKVLADQRPQLVKMMKSLDRLSGITVKTLHASQQDIVDDLKRLDPILTQLADAGSALPDSLQILLTYPFPDSVLGAIKGDYFNVFVTTNFRTLPANCAEEGCAWPQVGSGSAETETSGSAPDTSPSDVKQDDSVPPTLLQATDSALPGLSSSSVAVPSGTPSGSSSSATPGSSGSSSGVGSTSGPSGTSSSGGGSPSGSGSPSSSDSPGASGSPSGTSSSSEPSASSASAENPEGE